MLLFAQSNGIAEKLVSMPNLLFLLMFGGWIITGVVHSLSSNWRKAKESEHMAVLKQQMLDRGLSANEIEKVVNAGRGKPTNLMS